MRAPARAHADHEARNQNGRLRAAELPPGPDWVRSSAASFASSVMAFGNEQFADVVCARGVRCEGPAGLDPVAIRLPLLRLRRGLTRRLVKKRNVCTF
jgi:hypothetical protein